MMSHVETFIAVVFWILLGLVVYTYALYPIVIWCCARLARPRVLPDADEEYRPSVALLIAAYNEESIIEERILNALQTEYPKSKLVIVIASDGSSDSTAELVTAYQDRGVQLLNYPNRRGKALVLNETIPRLPCDITVLSDANTEFRPDAITQMVQWFRDPEVGAVVGELYLRDPRAGKNVDHLYWKYESFLKRCESRLDALSGAHGAIYALRTNLFTPLPIPTILDDIMIPLHAKLLTGCRIVCRIVYEQAAVAWEDIAPDLQVEFRRRCRIGAGAFQSLRILGAILNPRHGWLTFSFISHKLFRWLSPFFLVLLLVSNLMLLDIPLYQVLLAGQLTFYGMALLGIMVLQGAIWKAVRICTMFCVVNLALICGFLIWLTQHQKGTWRPTPRSVT
jgi:cellulose synthase/poly-beta-1,6-N-acetylglucosamine synthase-like glycosyltransferase